MAALQMGVLDQAYTHVEGGKAEPTTTGDVAEILEDRYHVMRYFFAARYDEIANAVSEALANSLQDLLNGRNVRQSPTYGAEQKIEASFRSFLDANEMQTLSVALAGVPISRVAAQGYSSRRRRNPLGRPAFVDTGLYRSSFRAVIEL